MKFETYAIARIKGAIIDELRAMDWVPRSVRSRAREIELQPGLRNQRYTPGFQGPAASRASQRWIAPSA